VAQRGGGEAKSLAAAPLRAAGVLSVVPALNGLAYGFGLLQIVWYAGLGIAMLRAPFPVHLSAARVTSTRPETAFAQAAVVTRT